MAVRTQASAGDLLASFESAQVPLVSLIKGFSVDHFDVATAVDHHLNNARQFTLLVEFGEV